MILPLNNNTIDITIATPLYSNDTAPSDIYTSILETLPNVNASLLTVTAELLVDATVKMVTLRVKGCDGAMQLMVATEGNPDEAVRKKGLNIQTLK